MEHRRMSRAFVPFAAVLVFCGMRLELVAQDEVPGWEGLATSNLDTVYVLDDMGSETTGTLVGLDADSVSVLVNGMPRRFERARVQRLQKRGDSLANGALIGALVGGVLSAIGAAAADCPTASDNGCPGTKAGLVLLGTAIYSGVGVGIDALVTGRTTLYEASNGAALRFPGVRPEAGDAPGALVRLSFRW